MARAGPHFAKRFRPEHRACASPIVRGSLEWCAYSHHTVAAANLTAMAFALADDHLDHDEIRTEDLLVPRPAFSCRFYVKDDQLAPCGILRGDLTIVERNQRLRGGRVALVNVDGKSRLVRVLQDGGRFSFEDLPAHDVSVDVIGVATRVLRVLVP